MENGSQAQGHVAERTSEKGNGEGINWRSGRKAGSRPGTFQNECVVCQGKGCMRASGPYNVWNTCLTCGGEGTVVRDGEREGDSDRRTQPTWGDVLWFCLWTAVITAGFCWLLISRAGAH